MTDGVLHAYAEYFGGYAPAGMGNMGGLAQFFDTLTLTSDVLANGAPVAVAIRLNASMAISNCAAASVSAAVYINNQEAVPSYDDAVVRYGEQHCTTLFDVPDAIVSATIGEQIIIRSLLTAAVGFNNLSLPSIADASNSASFTITPLGDFTYTTLSGNDYAPIPEPGSLLLLGVGGVALVARLRTLRSRRALDHDGAE